MTVTKKEFVDQLRDECGLTRNAANEVYEDFWKVMIKNIREGNEMRFTRYGTFGYTKFDARTMPGPNGAMYEVPAYSVMRFAAGKYVKDALRAQALTSDKGAKK